MAMASPALSLPALADPLAVTPGLWEVTSAGAGTAGRPLPQIPADQMAKLTPQQQQTLQQRLAAGGGRVTTRKLCVTQTMLNKGFQLPESDNRHCTTTPVTRTAAVEELKLACTGKVTNDGTLTIQAQDEHTVTVTLDMSLTMENGQTMPIHRVSQGKWLGADCGDVKPHE
jgi:Protein of unknown function (DUF3617)